MEREESAAKVRVAALIARRGVASRRESEEIVFGGRVTVNGHGIDHPAFLVDPDADEVRIDGKRLKAEPPRVWYVLYKPKGWIVGKADPDGPKRPSVWDVIETLPVRVEPVGRLDTDAEGALLLTNDGEVANALNRPKTQAPRRYMVKCWRTPPDNKLAALREGRIFVDDKRVRPAKVRVVNATGKGNAWVEVTVTEGGTRLVPRIFTAMGHPVAKVRRESFATISVRGLERGQLRPLTEEEVRRLRDIAGGVAPARAGRASG